VLTGVVPLVDLPERVMCDSQLDEVMRSYPRVSCTRECDVKENIQLRVGGSNSMKT